MEIPACSRCGHECEDHFQGCFCTVWGCHCNRYVDSNAPTKSAAS